MTKHTSKLAGWAASLLTLAATASADVKIDEHLSVSGYAVATGAITDPKVGDNKDTLFDSGNTNFDAVKTAIMATYGPVSGKASVFYVPESTSGNSEAGLLDGYATYTTGPVAVTAGKFLSYLGYEAWDPINMTTISYGNSWNPIPGYHTGAKIDYTGQGFTLGAAVLDSLYMDGAHFFGGDGDFGNALGYEIAATYTAIPKLTVFGGVGIEEVDGGPTQSVYDFWASYAVSDSLSIAGEYSLKDDGVVKADWWSLFATYTVAKPFAVTGRISGNFDTGGAQYTVAPTYTINDHFSIRAEITYASSDASAVQLGSEGSFYALQGIFKF